MSASKLKNLVILILLLANLFLLIQVLPGRLREKEQETALMDRMIQLFEQENVSLEMKMLPQTKAMYLRTLPADQARDEAMVCALLGEDTEIHRLEYETTFTSPLGSASLSDGVLVAQVKIPAEDPLAFTETCLDAMGIAQRELTLAEASGYQICSVRYNTLGSELLNYKLSFRYKDGDLLNVMGFLLPADTALLQGNVIALGAQDALLKFLSGRENIGWTGSHVYALEQGMAVRAAAGSNDVELRPCWYITTDTGVYTIDGLTGNLSA